MTSQASLKIARDIVRKFYERVPGFYERVYGTHRVREREGGVGMKLFEDMTYEEKLNHIEQCQKEAAECIRNCEPSQLADIADHVDIWGPWMLRELRAKRPDLREAVTTLQLHLKDPGYRAVWFANLSMSVYDEMLEEIDFTKRRDIANKSAQRFIDLLLSDDTP